MPWGKLDDSLYDHPKLDELPQAMRMPCVGLWAVAISWCNRRLTDGHVPTGRIRLLGGTIQQADALVAARLFEKVADGYLVHDFLDFNDSREYVMSRRAKDAERQRVLRESRQESQRDTARDSNGSNGVTPPVSPSPARGRVPGPSSPVPTLPGQPHADAARDDEPISRDESDVFAFIAQRGAHIRPDSPFGLRLLGLIDRRGIDPILETAKVIYQGEPLSDRQWVFGLEKALEAIPSPPMEELLPQGPTPREQRRDEATWRRRVEWYQQTGQWDPAYGPKPDEVTAA